MQTALQELIKWCIENAMYITRLDVVIDYEEMRKQFDSLLAKERQQIIDAYDMGQREIIAAVGEGFNQMGLTSTFSTIPSDDKEDGELYYSETFEKQSLLKSKNQE
jgi:tryptophan synthase beta subunit